MLSLIVIIAILDSTRVFRLTRAVAVNVVVMEYVERRDCGVKIGWIMHGEILPNIMPPLVAEFICGSFCISDNCCAQFPGPWHSATNSRLGFDGGENASLIQFAQFDIKAGITPLLPAGAIALLTIGVNFVVDCPNENERIAR